MSKLVIIFFITLIFSFTELWNQQCLAGCPEFIRKLATIPPAANSRAKQVRLDDLIWFVKKDTSITQLKNNLVTVADRLFELTPVPLDSSTPGMARWYLGEAVGGADNLDAFEMGKKLTELEKNISALFNESGEFIGNRQRRIHRVLDLDYVAGRRVKFGMFIVVGDDRNIQVVIAEEASDSPEYCLARRALAAEDPVIRQALGGGPLYAPRSYSIKSEGQKLSPLELFAHLEKVLDRFEKGSSLAKQNLVERFHLYRNGSEPYIRLEEKLNELVIISLIRPDSGLVINLSSTIPAQDVSTVFFGSNEQALNQPLEWSISVEQDRRRVNSPEEMISSDQMRIIADSLIPD